VTTRYYDAIVLGHELGPLFAGALLARRGARVLVAGNGALANRYRCFEYSFCRRPFSFTAGESPLLRRAFHELGLGQKLQLLLRDSIPSYQVITPAYRIDMCSDPAALCGEVDRERKGAGPGASRGLELIARLCGEIDKLLAADLVLPPGTFLERRQLARAEFQDPSRTHAEALTEIDALMKGELAEIFSAPSRFETAGAPTPLLARVRQAGALLFGHRVLDGGRDALVRLLTESIAAVGGDVHPRLRAAEISIARGRVRGVRMLGQDDLTGCRFVLVDMPGTQLARLVPAELQPNQFKALQSFSDRAFGYTLNVGLDAEVIPAALGHTAFLSTGPLQGADLLCLERQPEVTPGRASLSASCTVSQESLRDIDNGALRDAILDRLRWLMPFLDNHLRVVHSPQDGFGPIDLKGGAHGDTPAVPHPEQVARWEIPLPRQDAVLGLGDASHRTGITGLLQCGRQVMRSLGVEGELLSAWAGASVCGLRDHGNGKMARPISGQL
jgi:phytoene dehydrogenase-like protein